MKRCAECRKRAVMKGSRRCHTCALGDRKCRTCGRLITEPRRWAYCSPECSDMHFAQRRRDCAAEGICVRCGRKAKKDRMHCPDCLSRIHKANDKVRSEAPESTCLRCLKPNPDWPRRKTCPTCIAWSKAYRESMKDRTGVSWADYTRKLYNRKRRKNG